MRWVGRRVRALPGAIGYLMVGGVTSVVALFLVLAVLVVGAASLVGLGVPAIPEVVRVVRPVVGFERRRAGRRLGRAILVEYRPISGGLRERLGAVVGDPANRRDLGWLGVHGVFGTVIAVLAVGVPLGFLNQVAIPGYWQAVLPGRPVDSFGFQVTSWPLAWASLAIAVPLAAVTLQIPMVAQGQALLARALLGPVPDAGLAVRVAELTATRAAALDAHGAELRRIERDLHDGAQARIAAVIMQLGLADQLRERDSATADELVRKAQETAEAALVELRDVVRSVYPPVLADRGLASALGALAARSPIPVQLNLNGGMAVEQFTSIDDARAVGGSATPGTSGFGAARRSDREASGSALIGRLPAAVEAAAYFVIAEALTNATKHSGAQGIQVSLTEADGNLAVEVRDDGLGGAHESEGGGLAGIRRRAEALDGRMTLNSPTGGPTVIRVELPCGL